MSAFDFILIGGGSAGCVLASRLSAQTDNRILLLEAGGRDRNVLFHIPAGFARMTKGMASWGWSTVPQRHMNSRRVWFTQAKVIGGGSSINAQIYVRGNARDYDGWANEFGCKGWSYREVLPYFRRAESNERFNDTYHGIDGPLGVSMPKAALPVCDAFIRAAQDYGIPYNPDFNGRCQRGVGFYQLTQRDAKRCSTAGAYLGPAEERPNLTVVANAEVQRINIENGRAAGVVYRCKGRLDSAVADREVILSAGAIGSPRLLLLSGIGPAEHLKEVGIRPVLDLPGVGGNLQDHIDVCAIAELNGKYSYDGYEKLFKTGWAGLQYYVFRRGPAASPLFETGAFWYADESARSPDIQFHLGQGSGIEKGIVKIDGAGITLNSANMRPRSRGAVRLGGKSPELSPLIDPNYWSDQDDLNKSLMGLEMARDILAQPALGKFVRKEILPGPGVKARDSLVEYARRMAKTDHHPVGTCRMGNDFEAVVSPELKVHGIDGLRVCDASVMPAICSGNTNAATIMIAEKGADLISDKPPLPPANLKSEGDHRFAMA